jgi:hypothetical protein
MSLPSLPWRPRVVEHDLINCRRDAAVSSPSISGQQFAFHSPDDHELFSFDSRMPQPLMGICLKQQLQRGGRKRSRTNAGQPAEAAPMG